MVVEKEGRKEGEREEGKEVGRKWKTESSGVEWEGKKRSGSRG